MFRGGANLKSETPKRGDETKELKELEEELRKLRSDYAECQSGVEENMDFFSNQFRNIRGHDLDPGGSGYNLFWQRAHCLSGENRCRAIKNEIENKEKSILRKENHEKLKGLYSSHADCLFNTEVRKDERRNKFERLVREGVFSSQSIAGYLRYRSEQDENECLVIEKEIDVMVKTFRK